MAQTDNRNWPLPVPSNNISDDILVLIQTFAAIDVDVDALFVGLTTKAAVVHQHAIADISGLQAALDNKVGVGQSYSFDDLSNVSGMNGAADGYVPVKSATGWVPQSAAATLGVHEHSIAQILGLQAALNAKSEVGHNHDGRYYTQAQVDVAIAAAIGGIDEWSLHPIGAPLLVWDHIGGVNAPPTDKNYRYVELTAGVDGAGEYNEGVVAGEVVSGSYPDIAATFVIDLADSPVDGQTFELINTTREFLRPGSPGTREVSQNLQHKHGVRQSSMGGGGGTWSGGTKHNVTYPDVDTDYSGGDEARPRSIGITAYMRIA